MSINLISLVPKINDAVSTRYAEEAEKKELEVSDICLIVAEELQKVLPKPKKTTRKAAPDTTSGKKKKRKVGGNITLYNILKGKEEERITNSALASEIGTVSTDKPETSANGKAPLSAKQSELYDSIEFPSDSMDLMELFQLIHSKEPPVVTSSALLWNMLTDKQRKSVEAYRDRFHDEDNSDAEDDTSSKGKKSSSKGKGKGSTPVTTFLTNIILGKYDSDTLTSDTLTELIGAVSTKPPASLTEKTQDLYDLLEFDSDQINIDDLYQKITSSQKSNNKVFVNSLVWRMLSKEQQDAVKALQKEHAPPKDE